MESSNNFATPETHSADGDERRSRIIAISGPTAVGKSALAVALARSFGGEIVNADSRYLYRGFDIGVAKPDASEREGVPHHLIDILPPDGDMSLARYQELAMAAIADVFARSHLPLLVGGTPLYVNAVVEGWRIPRVPPNPGLRATLEAEAKAFGIDALADRLRAVDPVSAARSGNNLRRIVRALEIYESTGIPMSGLEGKGPPPFNALQIALSMPRQVLFATIDARVESMIARGLVEEVRGLIERGVSEAAPAMSSLGYLQLLPYLRGDCSLAESIERIQLDTHRYVRHQETWLRRNRRLNWFDVSIPGWQDAVKGCVAAFLAAPVVHTLPA